MGKGREDKSKEEFEDAVTSRRRRSMSMYRSLSMSSTHQVISSRMRVGKKRTTHNTHARASKVYKSKHWSTTRHQNPNFKDLDIPRSRHRYYASASSPLGAIRRGMQYLLLNGPTALNHKLNHCSPGCLPPPGRLQTRGVRRRYPAIYLRRYPKYCQWGLEVLYWGARDGIWRGDDSYRGAGHERGRCKGGGVCLN
jgi:hypothetical protein